MGAKNPLSVLALFVLGSAVANGQGQLWVVDDDPGPGVDFTDIQAAVNAAADGDAILVRDGLYSPVEITSKSLVVVGDRDANVLVQAEFLNSPVEVNALPPGGLVLLQGLDLVQSPSVAVIPAGLRVRNCAGSVWAEDLTVRAGNVFGGVEASMSASVALMRCYVEPPFQSFVAGVFPALHVNGSQVAVYESTLRGAEGRIPGSPSPPFLTCKEGWPGGAGAEVSSGSLFASGCSFVGGRGGDAVQLEHGETGRGSDGGPGAIVWPGAGFDWIECSFTAGAGGSPGFHCAGGAAGAPIEPGVPSDYEIPEVSRSLAAASPIRESEATTLTFAGEPLDFLVLGAAASPVHLDLPPFLGPLLVGVPSVTFKFGLLPAAGTKSLAASVGLDPAADFALLLLQTAHFGLNGEFVLSAPSPLVVLDDAF